MNTALSFQEKDLISLSFYIRFRHFFTLSFYVTLGYLALRYCVSRRYFSLLYAILRYLLLMLFYVHLTFSYVALRYVKLRSVNIFVTLRYLTLYFVNVLFQAWSATSWCRRMYGTVQPFGQTPHLWGSLHTSGQKWQVRHWAVPDLVSLILFSSGHSKGT